MNPQYPYYNQFHQQQWSTTNQYYQPQQFSQNQIPQPQPQFYPQQNLHTQSQQLNYPQLSQPYYPQLHQPFTTEHQLPRSNIHSQTQQGLYPDLPQPFSEQPHQPTYQQPQPYQQSQQPTYVQSNNIPTNNYGQPSSQFTKPTVYYPYLSPCFAFNPSTFTDTNNPWSASMWLDNPNSPSISYPQLASVPGSPNSGIESAEQFQKLRHHATVESALGQLNELAIDLSSIDPQFFIPSPSSCLICCNSYTTPKLQLGVGPVNDAITVAANHKYMGYVVYFLHNPHHKLFLKFFRVFLEKVTNYLTVYYSGHGAQIKDTSGDEADGYDEVMVFDSGRIIDDELAVYLNKYSRGTAHTLLISDCCHSGTIWDIPENLTDAARFPPNIMSISASNDSQTAKQKNIGNKNQGIFTYNFFALLRSKPNLTINEAENLLSPELRRFNQQIEFYPTRADMLRRPVFPLMAQKQRFF